MVRSSGVPIVRVNICPVVCLYANVIVSPVMAVEICSVGAFPSEHMMLIQRRLNVDATSRRCIDVEATL